MQSGLCLHTYEHANTHNAADPGRTNPAFGHLLKQVKAISAPHTAAP